MKTTPNVIALAAMLVLVGCAGGRGNIAANGNLSGPVSLTSHVFDGSGRTLSMGSDLVPVGKFSASTKMWATGASFISLSGTWDLTDRLNEAMQKHNGDAILNLSVKETSNFMLYDWLAAITLVLPSWTDVEVTGTVVRLRGKEEAKKEAGTGKV